MIGAVVVIGVAAGATVVATLGVGAEKEGPGPDVFGGAIATVSAADVEIVVPAGGTEASETEMEIAVATVVPGISCIY